MPNSRHSDAIVSPSLSRITNRIRSSMTELSFHGILLSAPFGPKSVTHVSGTFCYPCLGTDIEKWGRVVFWSVFKRAPISQQKMGKVLFEICLFCLDFLPAFCFHLRDHFAFLGQIIEKIGTQMGIRGQKNNAPTVFKLANSAIFDFYRSATVIIAADFFRNLGFVSHHKPREGIRKSETRPIRMHARMTQLDAWYLGRSIICWLSPLVPEVS